MSAVGGSQGRAGEHSGAEQLRAGVSQLLRTDEQHQDPGDDRGKAREEAQKYSRLTFTVCTNRTRQKHAISRHVALLFFVDCLSVLSSFCFSVI